MTVDSIESTVTYSKNAKLRLLIVQGWQDRSLVNTVLLFHWPESVPELHSW